MNSFNPSKPQSKRDKEGQEVKRDLTMRRRISDKV